MDYQQHYNNLIVNCKQLNTFRTAEQRQGVYFEQHHILPKSLGGDNAPHNLVLLTAKEHVIAHQLLWKVYRNKQMAWAFTCFAMRKQHINLTATQYGASREAHNTANTGKNSSRVFLGKTHTVENRKRISEAKKEIKIQWLG